MDRMAVLRKRILSELRTMITSKGRNHWFMIYLTTLVLLFNLEFVYEAQVRQGIRYREIVLGPTLPIERRHIDDIASSLTYKD